MSGSGRKKPAVLLAPALLMLLVLASVSFAERMDGACVMEEPKIYSCDLNSVCTSGYVCTPPERPGRFSKEECPRICYTERTGAPTPPPGPPGGFIAYLTGSGFSPPLVAALICTLVMALLLMAAVLMGSEELKQFVRAELGQTIVTVLIVISIVGIVTGLDITLEKVAGGILSPCTGTTLPVSLASGLTTNQYAYCYMNNLYGLSKKAAGDSLKEGVGYAADAYSSTGVMTTRWFLLYIGFSIRPNADKRLDSEVKSQEFYIHEAYMISLLGQSYMLESIAPSLGSAALFLGVLLRALFYTRRLGGLLIAAGLALLLVWPATYLLAWVTLNVAVFGPQAISTAPDSTCPASCLIQPPYGYYTTNQNGVEMGKDTLNADQLAQEAAKEPDAARSARNVEDMLKKKIQPCYPAATTTDGTGAIKYSDSANCPISCRFYPTPADCNISACAKIPRACKTIRAMDLSNEVDDCTGGAGSLGPNKDWQCPESQCPNYCKQLLPQVRQDPDGLGVVPSTNADLCGTDADCQKCSLFLRRYHYSGDASAITAFASTNDNCKKCMLKTDSITKLPDCMLGVPSLLSGTCDALAACGARMSLDAWVKADPTKPKPDVCPTDCRILFAPPAGQEAYQDPTYNAKCLSEPIVTACKRCPVQCKINSTLLGAVDGGQKISDVPGLSGQITCAEAPKFTPHGSPSATMDPAETNWCRLCPMSCRFKETKENEYQKPFLSMANYPMACYYYPGETPVCKDDQGNDQPLSVCTAKLTYKSGNSKDCPAGWFEFESAEYGSNCPSIPPAPPKCSPTTQAYLRADDVSDSKCPPFIAQSPQFVNGLIRLSSCDPPRGDPDKPGYMVASVQPNTDASAECSTPTALKYCAPAYCPDSCKADRQTDGPFYCSLSDVTDKDALILDNAKRCTECAILGSGNSLGPQCQVMLIDTASPDVLLPRGCNADKCAIGQVDPQTGVISDPLPGIDPRVDPQPNCNGFCFPRLEIPACDAYVDDKSEGTTGPKPLPQFSRTFANGASCPLDCRYDYQKKRPTSAGMAYCGDGFEPLACGECEYAFGDTAPLKTTCEDELHYNDCSTQVKPERSDGWWFKTLDEIVEYDTNCPNPDPPPAKDCDKYEQSMESQGFKYTKGPIYACTALHKYPELDELLDPYRECGDVSIGGANPSLNLCNQIPDAPYSSNLPTPAECIAEYDATTVACQPLVSSPEPPAPDHCLSCPLFCRVDGVDVCAPKWGGSNWNRGGNPPLCKSPPAGEECDMRNANTGAPFPPGFCGVDGAVFKLDSSCQWPNEGYAAGCPARCRMLTSDNPKDLPLDCAADYADACSVEAGNLPLYCRAAPPSRLCQGCLECQADCTALPLVRQNCHELCLSSDFITAQGGLGAGDLASAMGGAAGITAWRNLGNEAIAAFVLPIFCILITLSFIRTLSPFLGGDIELPGILKLI